MSTVRAFCASCKRWFYGERDERLEVYCPACLTVGLRVDEVHAV